MACTVELGMTGGDGPICAAAGTFPGFCLGWGPVHICTILNWLRSMGCPVVILWWCIGEGALKCSLTLSPKDLPDS